MRKLEKRSIAALIFFEQDTIMARTMASSSKTILFVMISIVIFHICQGQQCKISLPQDVSRDSPCYKQRMESLAKQRSTYGIREPTPAMPFSRLDLSVKEYLAFLEKNPFQAFHGKTYVGMAKLTKSLFEAYTKKTFLLPKVMKLPEFAPLTHFFKTAMETHFDGYVKLPSNVEPFKEDMTKWISDEYFAEQRLAGVNPMTLQRVTFSRRIGRNWNDLKKSLNPNFDVEEAVRHVLGNFMQYRSLKWVIRQGYLFVLHHRLGDNMKSMPDISDNDPHRRMWNYNSPIALFVSVPGRHFYSEPRLMPVTIQMDSKPDSQVFTPKDGDLWTLAKLNVQLTDLLYSQIVEHLSKVHFVTEALCLSVERQLSERHPLYAIMKYHCRGVITANTVAVPNLLLPQHTIHILAAFGYKGSNYLVNETAKILDWKDLELRNNIRRRGLNNHRRLPYYPYRDDGRVILTAIRNMLTDYVHLYYQSSYDVREDSELQNFVNEVSAEGTGPNGGKGKIRGFPAKIKTKRQLIDTLTQMVWLMSAQHSAVNYPVADYGSYAPNMPMKLYDDDRVPNTTFSGARLPNRIQAAGHTSFSMALATLRYDRLFDYGVFLDDPEARQVIYRHFSVLTEEVEPLLNWRNKKRLRDGHLTYPYLLPRWLTNGVQT